jgi:cell division protease FtsH
MTTGAGNDIEQASDLARRMVCEFGMSSLGPVTFGKKEEQIFLGREINQHRDFSEETAQLIDKEVRQLVDAGYQSATQILSNNKDIMHRMSAALLEREVLDANEIKLIIEGRDLPPVKMPSSGDGVQQVLKPEPNRSPGLAPGHPSPA